METAMKPIPIALHGVIDYAAVLIFAAAPTALGLHDGPALLSYALAVVHLLMTLLTDFSAGAVRIVPLWVHNWVERLVGPGLILLAFVPLVGNTPTAQAFFIGMGVIIFAVERLTGYAATHRTTVNGRT
jgi:hypothetical protein